MKPWRGLLWGAAAAGLAACAASAPNHFYTLPMPQSAPAPATGAPTVGVGPVTIPEVLDRPQIIVSGPDNRVHIHESERWAESLGALVPRVIAAYLSAQLPGMRVGLSSDVTMGDASVRVLIDIVRLQGSVDGGSDLEARWSVLWPASKMRLDGHFEHHDTAARAGMDGVADAEARGLGALAGAIAEAVQSRH